jgi:hypothetical protein
VETPAPEEDPVAVLYIAVGLVGLALALVGIFQVLYVLAALGAALIFAAFFLFMRTNQGTPGPGKGDGKSTVKGVMS